MATRGNTEEDHLLKFTVLMLEQMTGFLRATPTSEEVAESDTQLAEIAVQLDLLEASNRKLS
jgi:hypothetical protein